MSTILYKLDLLHFWMKCSRSISFRYKLFVPGTSSRAFFKKKTLANKLVSEKNGNYVMRYLHELVKHSRNFSYPQLVTF